MRKHRITRKLPKKCTIYIRKLPRYLCFIVNDAPTPSIIISICKKWILSSVTKCIAVAKRLSEIKHRKSFNIQSSWGLYSNMAIIVLSFCKNASLLETDSMVKHWIYHARWRAGPRLLCAKQTSLGVFWDINFWFWRPRYLLEN